jgi:hypothetical protein
MKLNMGLTRNNGEDLARRATKTAPRLNEREASAEACIPKRFRRLKWNELVSRGDFVEDEHRGFEPWQGPNGFRAYAFVKPIYRRNQKIK